MEDALRQVAKRVASQQIQQPVIILFVVYRIQQVSKVPVSRYIYDVTLCIHFIEEPLVFEKVEIGEIGVLVEGQPTLLLPHGVEVGLCGQKKQRVGINRGGRPS